MTQVCPTCGHAVKERWEMLNAGLVYCLVQAVKAVHRKNVNRFHLQKDLNLTKTQYNNFQKLRYHALIAHADPENPKSGEWLITARGGQFLRGESAVPRRVLVAANRVIDHDFTQPVHIDQLKHKYPDFDPRYAYVAFLMPEKVEQPNLFAA